jgi:hypothetical protein
VLTHPDCATLVGPLSACGAKRAKAGIGVLVVRVAMNFQNDNYRLIFNSKTPKNTEVFRKK